METSYIYVVTKVFHSSEFSGSVILGAFATFEGAMERVRASFWGADFELVQLEGCEGYTAFTCSEESYEIERVEVHE